MRGYEDDFIVELYLKRDESAIRHTDEKYGPRLRQLAYRIAGDWSAAEECGSDTYLRAWNAIPPHEPRTYLFAFLARIARNLSLNRCRDKDRQKRKAFLAEFSAEMEECIPAPDDTPCRVDGILLAEAISAHLRGLPQQTRQVFLRRYFYLDSISDISREFRISESKVKTLLFRTRNSLRAYLAEEGYNL